MMEVDASEANPTSGYAHHRTPEGKLDESEETDAFEHAREALQVNDDVKASMPTASVASRVPTSMTQAVTSASGASPKSADDECSEELSEELSHRIADGVERAMNELKCVKAETASAMECAAREDRSTFDYDVTQDMERSEDVKMEMESFEYDEELPDTDGSNSVSLHLSHRQTRKGKDGVDHIEFNGFRYSYRTTLKSGARSYRCVLSGGNSYNCRAKLQEDPASGEVTLYGEHVHKTKAGKTGLFAMCNGYRMRSVHGNAKGELYWSCARQTKFKCSGAAKSAPDGGELVETRKHNHDASGDRPPRFYYYGHSSATQTDPPAPLEVQSVLGAAATRRQQESSTNSHHSLTFVEALEPPRTSKPPTIALTTSGPTSAINLGPTAAEPRAVWNFKSREAMRNADVVLHLRDTKLYAHKAILSAISPILDEAFRRSVGPMAVLNVDPSGIGHNGLEAFLLSIYPCGSEPKDEVLPQVTVLAYRYGIRPLLRKCLERVKHSSTLSKLDKLAVAVKITDVELEDQLIASFTKDDIRQLLQSDLQYLLGDDRLLKLLAKCVSL